MIRYELYDHAGQIPFAEWREIGVKVPVFDVDGTLRSVNQPGLDEEVIRGLEGQDFADIYPGAALASNNHDPEDIQSFGGLVASRLGIEVFAICQAERDAYERKPAPAMGLAIADHFGVNPNELGVIGDRRLTDVSFGRKLGAGAIALCKRVGSHDAPWVPALRVIEAGITSLERRAGMAYRPAEAAAIAAELAGGN